VLLALKDTKRLLNHDLRFAAQRHASKNMHLKIIAAERSDVQLWLEWPQRNDGIDKNQRDEKGRING